MVRCIFVNSSSLLKVLILSKPLSINSESSIVDDSYYFPLLIFVNSVLDWELGCIEGAQIMGLGAETTRSLSSSVWMWNFGLNIACFVKGLVHEGFPNDW